MTVSNLNGSRVYHVLVIILVLQGNNEGKFELLPCL